jgi:hypothetical protein
VWVIHRRIWSPAGKSFSIGANSSSSDAAFGPAFVLSNWTSGTFPSCAMNRSIRVSQKAVVPLGVALSTTSEIP